MLGNNYQIEFSESFAGRLHAMPVAMNELVPGVMPLECAVQNLIQGYISFLLTVGCNTVSIYFNSNGVFNLFDSHARDSSGMSNPHGTCILIQINSVNDLVEYLRHMYAPDILFELKGVKITIGAVRSSIMSEKDTTSTENIFHCGQYNIVLCYYALCFSAIMKCTYWNTEKLNAISEFSRSLSIEYINNNQTITCNDIPSILNICGADVNVTSNGKHEDVLDVLSLSSKSGFEALIKNYIRVSGGFLLWFPNYCFSCVFEHYTIKATKYFLIGYFADKELNVFEKFDNINAVVDILCKIVQEKLLSHQTQYNIQFISCSCELTKSQKNKVLQNHKSLLQSNFVQSENKKIVQI